MLKVSRFLLMFSSVTVSVLVQDECRALEGWGVVAPLELVEPGDLYAVGVFGARC